MTILYSFVFEQSRAIDHVNDSIFCQNAICHGIIPLCRAGQHFIGQTRLPLHHVFDCTHIYWTRWPQSQFRVVQAYKSRKIFFYRFMDNSTKNVRISIKLKMGLENFHLFIFWTDSASVSRVFSRLERQGQWFLLSVIWCKFYNNLKKNCPISCLPCVCLAVFKTDRHQFITLSLLVCGMNFQNQSLLCNMPSQKPFFDRLCQRLSSYHPYLLVNYAEVFYWVVVCLPKNS